MLGRKCEKPVYRLLGYERAFGKQPYVVVPFATTPEKTFERMSHIRQDRPGAWRDLARSSFRPS
jgi:hypothetical protein